MTTPSLFLGGGSLLHQVARDLGTALDRRLAPFGVTAQQAALLLHVSRGQASPRQLITALGTDTAGMTKLADRLEAKHLVERRDNPEDRRSILIALTASGEELVPRLRPVFGRVTRQLFNDFSAEQIEILTTMLERMRINLSSDAA